MEAPPGKSEDLLERESSRESSPRSDLDNESLEFSQAAVALQSAMSRFGEQLAATIPEDHLLGL
jgi:hypothetical protein